MKNQKWSWLNDTSREFLGRGYLAEGQTAEERIQVIADEAEEILGIPGFSAKFYEFMSKGWISLASPVWSNFGTDKGLPISCFGSYIGDNMGSILHTQGEVGMMSKHGGGCSGYFGALRGRGESISGNGHSSGAVHFMQLFDTLTDVVSQGSVRRGHFSPYLPVEHPDIMEFLDLGSEGNAIQKLTHGVTVGDEWLQSMKDGDAEKRTIWAKVLQRRKEMGYPYIMYSDNANNAKPQTYKDKDLTIYASNMCSEIMLPSKEDWSFVCCLSSINLLHYDEWKDTDLVQTMTLFLDAVMEEFIRKLEALRDSEDSEENYVFRFMERAYNFAKANRALGLGVLGYHSLLQSKMIPFESQEARDINNEVFAVIRKGAEAASRFMATELGEPEVMKGYGMRNATLMAIAPTTSSAFILGQVSQGIEPVWSNCYIKDVAKAKVVIKNNQLLELLEQKGENTKETWHSIRDHDGSVQHLNCLRENEKAVFKTFGEINQEEIIDQAGDRQQFIDQGQSLNIKAHPNVSAKEMNILALKAWDSGIKALYYQHSDNAAQSMVRERQAKK